MADTWYTNAYENNKIYKRTGFSSTIDASVTSTGTFCCSWDGTNICFTGDVNVSARSVKKGTGFTTTVASSFNFPTANDCYAQTYDASGNIMLVGGTTKVYKMTGFSSTINASISLAGETLRGVAEDSSANLITGATTSGTKVRKHSGFSATISTSVSGYPDQGATGITMDGSDNLIGGTNVTDRYRQYTGLSTTVSSSFAYPTGQTSMQGTDYIVGAAAPSNPSIISDIILFN